MGKWDDAVEDLTSLVANSSSRLRRATYARQTGGAAFSLSIDQIDLSRATRCFTWRRFVRARIFAIDFARGSGSTSARHRVPRADFSFRSFSLLSLLFIVVDEGEDINTTFRRSRLHTTKSHASVIIFFRSRPSCGRFAEKRQTYK